MLNGIDPIIIFNLSKKLFENTDFVGPKKPIPIVSKVYDTLETIPVPVYLSEELTGLLIDTEEKAIDINTNINTNNDGSEPDISQKGASSIVRVNLEANRNSIGVTLLAALGEQVFNKASSAEYSITYLNGAVTVFNGRLNSFVVQQNRDNTLYNISFELVTTGSTKTEVKKGPQPIVPVHGEVPLSS